MMRKHFVFAIALAISTQSAHADTVLLGQSSQNSNGVRIVATSPTSDDTDTSYKAFSTVRKGQLSAFDYYYSLEIYPGFKGTGSACQSSQGFGDFISRLISSLGGISEAGVLAIKTDIQYRWGTGLTVNFITNDALLALAATGTNPTVASPGNGCFFDQTQRPTFPLLQYQGGGASANYDDFVIKFIVSGGYAKQYNLINNAVGLFGDVSAFAGWSAVSSGLNGAPFQAFKNAANMFQTALQNAGTVVNSQAVDYTLKVNGGKGTGRLAITIPNLFGSSTDTGSMIIYVRRVGSIALTGLDKGTPVSVQSIASNLQLANRTCNPSQIAGNNCNTGVDSLRITLAKALAPIDPAICGGDASKPNCAPDTLLFAPDDAKRSALIYRLCKGIRTVSTVNLHLSTLDALLVRWAFTKEANVQASLQDPTKLAALAAATPDKINGAAVTGKDIKDMCWNDSDDATLKSVIQSLQLTIQ